MDFVDSIGAKARQIRLAPVPLHGVVQLAAATLGWLIIAAILGVMAVADYTVIGALVQSH